MNQHFNYTYTATDQLLSYAKTENRVDQKSLISAFESHINSIEKLEGTQFAHNTVRKYKSVLNSLYRFLHFQILAIFAEFERSLISDRTRIALRRKKEVDGVTLGRPVGSKDKKSRRKSGYILRYASEKQESASQIGIHKPIQDFIDKK